MPLGEFAVAGAVLTPLVLLSGIISGSETALFGLSHPGRARLNREAPGAARAVAQLLARPRPLLTALLACNILVNVSFFSVSSLITVRLEEAGHPLAAAALATGSLAAIILIGEIAAKLLASAQRIAFCRVVAGPWLLVMRLGWPVWSRIDRGILGPLVRVASAPDEAGPVQPSSDAIARVLAVSADASSDEHAAADQRLLLQILGLRQIRAREAMQPRIEVVSCLLKDPPEAVLRAVRAADRVLVCGDTDGVPIGWLDPHAFFAAGQPTSAWRREHMLEPCVYVPDQATLDMVLDQLRTHGRERAVVVDERGEFVGVVRIEEVAAQLLDEVAEQREQEWDEPRLVALGRFEVPGRWPARGLLDDLAITHAAADRLLSRVSTVGGLVLGLIGKLPEPGDEASLPGATFRVVEISGRAITKVEIDFSLESEPRASGEGPA